MPGGNQAARCNPWSTEGHNFSSSVQMWNWRCKLFAPNMSWCDSHRITHSIVVPKNRKMEDRTYLPVKCSLELQLRKWEFPDQISRPGNNSSRLPGVCSGLLVLSSASSLLLHEGGCWHLGSFSSPLLVENFGSPPIFFVPFRPSWQCFCWNNFLMLVGL